MNVSQSTFLNLGVLLDLGYKIINLGVPYYLFRGRNSIYYLGVETRFIWGSGLIYLGELSDLIWAYEVIYLGVPKNPTQIIFRTPNALFYHNE